MSDDKNDNNENTDSKVNEFFYKSSSSLRKGLAEVQAKVNDLYRVEELEEYVDVKDSPIEYIQAALAPLIVQVNDFQDYAETITDRMKLDLEEMDIYAALDGVMTMADQLMESKSGVTLEEDIEETCPPLRPTPPAFHRHCSI